MNFFISLSLVFVCVLSLADDKAATSQSTLSDNNLEQSKYSLGVFLETSSFTYEESHMKDSGTLNGFNLLGQYKFTPSFAMNGRVNYLSGKLEYDGQLMSGTPLKSDDHYTVLDLSLETELLTDLSRTVDTSFIFGLGTRTTSDANDPTPYDYRREHIYNYYTFVLQTIVPHKDSSQTKMYLGFDNMISGHVKTYLSDVDARYPDMDMKFSSGTALKLGVSHSRQFNFGRIYGGISYKKWSLADSEVAVVKINGVNNYMVEPSNATTVLALDLGLIF